MRLLKLNIIIFCFVPKLFAQSPTITDHLISGAYEEVKLSVSSDSKKLSGLVEDRQGNISCSLFFTGKADESTKGKYVIKAFPFGLMDTIAFYGTLTFRPGKNGHSSEIKIQLNESGSCQNIINLKQGVFFSLEKVVPYNTFTMVKSKKAIAYVNSDALSKKGYFLQGDVVSILAEKNNFCYVEFSKKPSFKSWVKKNDLIQ